MAKTEQPDKKAINPRAEALFQRGLAMYEGRGLPKNEYEGARLIFEAAKLGHPEAQDWADDYAFDDDAMVQGES